MPITTARQLTNTALLRDILIAPVQPDRPAGRSSSKRTTPPGTREHRQSHNCASGALVRMPLWRTAPVSRHRLSFPHQRRKGGNAKSLLDNERCKQGKQVENGDAEQPPRIRLPSLIAF